MQLKLKELQKVAKATMKEQKVFKKLCEEMYRVLGPSIVVPGDHNKVAAVANEQLDILESTGKMWTLEPFDVSVLLEAGHSSSPHVRKLVARLLPEKHASKFLKDSSSSVRCAAAKNCSHRLVREAVELNPKDDQLRVILRRKKLEEAGLPNPKPVEEPFDLYGEKPLGAAAKQHPGQEISDGWYERLAHKLCSEYGSNIEGQWEEVLASRVAASFFATSGVKLDREKLLQCIYDCIEEREDRVMGEGILKRSSRKLLSESYLDSDALPIIEEKIDVIQQLIESRLSSSEYVEKAEKVFSVKKSSVPAGIKKYRMGESISRDTQVPVLGRLPSTNRTITSTVEKALDNYVKSWNTQQTLKGEPYKLSWYPHPSSTNMVGFSLELK